MALYPALVGHTLERFGMVTVLDATFYDITDGKPLIHFDTLKMSNISSEGQQKEIRGGQGAELLLAYDYGRTANVEITDALASMYSVQYLWGGNLAITAFDFPVRFEFTAVTADTIPTPLPHTQSTTSTGYTLVNLTTNTSTTGTGVPGGTFTAGARVVLYYIGTKTPGTTAAHVHQLTLTSTDFPPIVKLVGDTFVIDQDTGKKVAMQIEIPRFKLDANFSFTLEAEGDASVFDFSGVALSDNGNIMYLRTLGQEA